MPVASAIILNGVTFSTGVKNITEPLRRVGKRKEAANGNPRFFLRGSKRSWEISFENLPIATINQLRTIALLSSSFAYTDEAGTSFTVICQENALEVSRPEILQDGTIAYEATLRIEQT